MELLELVKVVVGQPLSVILLLGLVVVYLRGEKKDLAHQEEVASLHARNEETHAQNSALVRETVAALQRVADHLNRS
jgi:hypothetical protein